MKRTVILALLSGMLAIFCTACEGDSNPYPMDSGMEEETTETPTEPETLSSEEISGLLSAATTPPAATPEEPDTQAAGETDADFGTAVFWGKLAEDEIERFFLFYGNGGGTCMEQETGAATVFTFEMTGTDTAVFHFGADTRETEIYWLDPDTAELTWDSGEFETLTRLPDMLPAEFRFYSNEVLKERALDLFAQKNGYRPAGAYFWTNYDGQLSIQLYDTLEDGHEFSCDWYTIDRFTGLGTNLMGEKINLSDTPDALLPAETAPSTDPTLPTEPIVTTQAPETTAPLTSETTSAFRF